MAAIELHPAEIIQKQIDQNISKMMRRFEDEAQQGIIPSNDRDYYEQNNWFLRSDIYSICKSVQKRSDAPVQYDWRTCYTLGNVEMMYRGPKLGMAHQLVMGHIHSLARGQSVFRPVNVRYADVVRWLNLKSTGTSYKRAREIIDDLKQAEIKVSGPEPLEALIKVMTSHSDKYASQSGTGALTSEQEREARFYRDWLDIAFGAHIKRLKDGIAKNQNVSIEMRFINESSVNDDTKELTISLSPVTTLFLDGIHTTLVPFDVLSKQTSLGAKLLLLIATHKSGMWPIELETIHKLTRSVSSYSTVSRKLKQKIIELCTEWEAAQYIQPGWQVLKNKNGAFVLAGTKLGAGIKIKSKLASEKEAAMREYDTDSKPVKPKRSTSKRAAPVKPQAITLETEVIPAVTQDELNLSVGENFTIPF